MEAILILIRINWAQKTAKYESTLLHAAHTREKLILMRNICAQ